MTTANGVQLRLRLIEPTDAAFVHALRTDERYNAYLSPVTGDVADQRSWIERYQHRQVRGAEYYYVIERRQDGAPCGLVRLYDIEDDRFTWGSWILADNKPSKAALESALLSFGKGFFGLGKPYAIVDVRKDNNHAIAFYRRFGMIETSEVGDTLYFEYRRELFEREKRRLWAEILEGVTS